MSLNKFSNTTTGYDLKLEGGFDDIKTNNIDTTTINGSPYPPEGIDDTTQQIPTTQLGNTIAELDLTNTKHAYSIALGVKESATIETITPGSYTGQVRTIYALRNSQITIKHNVAGSGASIVCANDTDAILYPTQPNFYVVSIVLVWNNDENIWMTRVVSV